MDMDLDGMKSTYDDSKIAVTYDEKILEIQGYELEKEVIESLKKVVMGLGKARVEYMTSGSNTPILREIFNLEKKIHQEITDIENLDLI